MLLADDDPNDRFLVRQAVTRNGHAIDLHEVADGNEVIDYLRGAEPFSNRAAYPIPDLLLLDLKMPRLDGLRVLDWLKKNPRCARIPVVMMSGSGLEKDVAEAYRRGVNTYFTKPVGFGQLQSLIRLVLDYWSESER